MHSQRSARRVATRHPPPRIWPILGSKNEPSRAHSGPMRTALARSRGLGVRENAMTERLTLEEAATALREKSALAARLARVASSGRLWQALLCQSRAH